MAALSRLSTSRSDSALSGSSTSKSSEKPPPESRPRTRYAMAARSADDAVLLQEVANVVEAHRDVAHGARQARRDLAAHEVKRRAFAGELLGDDADELA